MPLEEIFEDANVVSKLTLLKNIGVQTSSYQDDLRATAAVGRINSFILVIIIAIIQSFSPWINADSSLSLSLSLSLPACVCVSVSLSVCFDCPSLYLILVCVVFF